MKKENKNFLYNLIYQIFSLLMPLITAPYISRVLGAENIGIFSYTYSIVSYFMLFALLGINNYGSREIAKMSRLGDRKKLSELFSEIYSLQFILGCTAIIVYLVGTLLLSGQDKIVMLVQGIYILSAVFDINWFYFGLEKFKLTVTRNMVIRVLSLILIFTFVRNSDDLIKYVAVMSISALISQLYLWIYLKKYASLIRPKLKDIFKHFKECLLLFIPVVAYSIYRIMDKTMLGGISGVETLGYYQNAENIINIPVVMIAALGTVMLPSMSKTALGREFNDKLFSSFELVFLFVMPVFFSLLNTGTDIAVVLYGEDFAPSGDIIKMLAVTAVFAGIANVIRTNYLIPRRKDRTYVISTIIGAIVNFILNLLLIPKFNAYGACIGTIAAEFSVMAYQIFATRNDINYKRMCMMLGVYILKALPIYLSQIAIMLFIDDPMIRLTCCVLVSVFIFGLLNYKYILYNFIGMKNNAKSSRN